MPCLFPTSEQQVDVLALHETVFVNRVLSWPPTVELCVVSVVNVREVGGARLWLVHRGSIDQVQDVTQQWEAFATADGDDEQHWLAELVNATWLGGNSLRPHSAGTILWRSNGTECQVTVRPDQVRIPEEFDGESQPMIQTTNLDGTGEALYSRFAVEFESPGLQLLAFRFVTRHGVSTTGDDIEVQIEGPERGVSTLRDYVLRHVSDRKTQADLLSRIGKLWARSRIGEGSYSVAVVPHPTLEPIVSWPPGGPEPPSGRLVAIGVDNAPQDLSFAEPHSDAQAIAFHTEDTKFAASTIYRPAHKRSQELDAAWQLWKS